MNNLTQLAISAAVCYILIELFAAVFHHFGTVGVLSVIGIMFAICALVRD